MPVWILYFALSFLAIDVIFLGMIFASRAAAVRKSRIMLLHKKAVVEASAVPGDARERIYRLRIKTAELFDIYRDLAASVEMPEEVKSAFIRIFAEQRVAAHLAGRLRSSFKRRRAEAALKLGFLPLPETHRALEEALVSERHYHVKVYIVNSLVDSDNHAAIPYIIQTLIGAPRWYREKVYGIMEQFGGRFHDFMLQMGSLESRELRMLVLNFAAFFYSPKIKGLLEQYLKSDDRETALAAAEACRRMYPEMLNSEYYLKSRFAEIRKTAIECISLFPSANALEIVLNSMRFPGLSETGISAVHRMIMKRHELFSIVMSRFIVESNPVLKNVLARVLSMRIDYLFTKLRRDSSDRYRGFIKEIILRGEARNVISFLNINRDSGLEDVILGIMLELIDEGLPGINEYQVYLDGRILERLGFSKAKPEASGPRKEHVRRGILYGLLCAAILIFPLIFYYSSIHGEGITGVRDIAVMSIRGFNRFFAFYAGALNGIYLLLLLFSFHASSRQLRQWKARDKRLLFKKGMLPSISVIAPAFNEEATIIESVSSLINLSYPDYEVIVVNDGSSDGTLRRLVDWFGLKRTATGFPAGLETGTVRGVYGSPSIRNLIVIDKVNGGKADSLNAGINFSSKEYICGIDADSLLQSDSLLKLTSPFLDSDTETLAAGGNILPVNGCSVDRGHLDRVDIPRKILPALQTIEYARSFTAGRAGWAFLNSLLIISGAFGLFKKQQVLDMGGYLTGREKYGKDTVGEDMELVVRMIRHSVEFGRPGRVSYVFNANCWTEVPEDIAVLRRQRNRWQRGLLDTVTFHLRMAFNPRYGAAGLIAFPYFILFEIAGPWIEVQGLLMFLLGLSLGMLDGGILLMLFTAAVLMGLSVSIVSLYILERGGRLFPLSGIVKLAALAFAENFGIRQLFSVSRLEGYIHALRQKQGWGGMVRKGFRGENIRKGASGPA